jgi:hypothetical protein
MEIDGLSTIHNRGSNELEAIVKRFRARLKVTRRVDDIQVRTTHHQTRDSRSADTVTQAQLAPKEKRVADVPQFRQKEPSASGPYSMRRRKRQNPSVERESADGCHDRHPEYLSQPLSPRRDRICDEVVRTFRAKCFEVLIEYFRRRAHK